MTINHRFVVTPDPDDGGYVVHFPALSGCLTQVETLAELEEFVQGAYDLWCETMVEVGNTIPPDVEEV